MLHLPTLQNLLNLFFCNNWYVSPYLLFCNSPLIGLIYVTRSYYLVKFTMKSSLNCPAWKLPLILLFYVTNFTCAPLHLLLSIYLILILTHHRYFPSRFDNSKRCRIKIGQHRKHVIKYRELINLIPLKGKDQSHHHLHWPRTENIVLYKRNYGRYLGAPLS